MSKFAELFKSSNKDTPPEEVIHFQDTSNKDYTKFTLLFVDDEENILNALKRTFFEENYEIFTATSGEKAIEIMSKDTVHLVISDHRMPNMLGSEFLKEIKNRWPQTIRIMLTGNADVQAIMGAVNEGAVYKFIIKPWNDEDLRLTVSRALQQYVLIEENKRLKERTKEQEKKLKEYCSIFNEYKGILGKILVDSGVITQGKLNTALKEKRADEFISDTVVRLGFAAESQIIKTIQKSQGVDYVDLKEIQISENIARLFTKEYCVNNRILPIKLEGKRLTIAMADPSDIPKIDNIAMSTGFSVTQVVATSSAIMSQIEKIYGKANEYEITAQDIDETINYEPLEEIDVVIEDEEDINIKELINMSGVPPIIRIVNAILMEALRYHASDIHIESKTKYSIIRFRIDGILFTKVKIPSNIHAATVSRIKVLAKMDIAEHRKPQDGRITIKVGTRIVDLRISIMPTISGEKAVIRILDKNSSIKRLPELGVLDDELSKLEVITKKPQGIIISTGPTGSGKTTMLYSILYEMLKSTKNFETIEDPVEYFLEEANQIHVKESIGLSFATVLRAMLRQDPDVILVGEIRDYETADVAFKAALTGHLVLTTLHTNSAVASITRLIDIGVKPYLIASAIEGILAQRLVRKVCKYCQITIAPDDKMIKMLKIPEGTFSETVVGKGCNRCNNSGFYGRTGLFEIFIMDDQLRHIISTNYKESEILKCAKASGMRTLLEVCIEKVKMGITTLEELVRVIGPPVVLERKCNQCKKLIDINFTYCPYCGTFREGICANCNTLLEDGWIICPLCGASRVGISSKNTDRANLIPAEAITGA